MSDAPIPIDSFNAAPDQQQSQPQAQEPVFSEQELANGFLKNVDPRDRPVVDKYIKDWDRGVNQRFREIHDEYRPYKDLGVTPAEVQQAINIARLIDSDPRFVWDTIGREFGFGGEGLNPASNGAAAASNAVGQNGTGGTVNPAYEGLPEPFVTEFTQMRDLLMAMGQRFLDQEKTSKQQQEDQQLDSYMNNLHQQFGDFDDDWVLAKMWSGQDGIEAVKAYKAFVQNIINNSASSRRQVPPVLAGSGYVPAGVNPADLSREQAKGLMADMLAKAAQAGQ